MENSTLNLGLTILLMHSFRHNSTKFVIKLLLDFLGDMK